MQKGGAHQARILLGHTTAEPTARARSAFLTGGAPDAGANGLLNQPKRTPKIRIAGQNIVIYACPPLMFVCKNKPENRHAGRRRPCGGGANRQRDLGTRIWGPAFPDTKKKQTHLSNEGDSCVW